VLCIFSSIALWSILKKKPLVTVKNAHNGKSLGDIRNESNDNWISAVAAVHNTDLVASGNRTRIAALQVFHVFHTTILQGRNEVHKALMKLILLVKG